MAVIQLTDRGLRALRTPRPQEDFWDRSLPGFGIRVSQFGRRSFVVMYRTLEGRRKRRLTLGTYPALSLAEAREKAKVILYDVARGNDPQALKIAMRGAHTFSELAEHYLEKYAKRTKKSWRVDQCILRKDLLPAWGSRKAKDISRRDVIDLLERIVARGAPIKANSTLKIISKIFNFAVDEEILESSPAQRVTRPSKPRSRDRVLSESELVIFWHALEQEELIVASSLKLRLLTAQRGVEVLSMRWSDVDGEWWTIPAEVAKNGHSHRVPLSPQAAAILQSLEPLTRASEWIFANPNKPKVPIRDREAALRLRETTGIEFTPHDLRRTAASHMTGAGIPRLVVSKILNHVETGITAVYDRHSYDAEKRQALHLWGQKLEETVSSSRAASRKRQAV